MIIMPFALDVHLHDGGRHVASSKHFSTDDDQPLDDAVRAVLLERAGSIESIQQNEGPSIAEVALGLVSRIKSVASHGGTKADLTKFLQGQESKFPLRMLDSDSTPILKHVINVYLHPPRTEPSTNKEPTATINDRLMNVDEAEVRFLPKPADKDSPRLDEQVRDCLTVLFGSEGVGLGYFNPNQKKCLVLRLGQLTFFIAKSSSKRWGKRRAENVTLFARIALMEGSIQQFTRSQKRRRVRRERSPRRRRRAGRSQSRPRWSGDDGRLSPINVN